MEAQRRHEADLVQLNYLNEKDRKFIEREEAAKAAKWKSGNEIMQEV